MTLFIIVFGALTCLAGIVILLNPELVFGYIRKSYNKTGMYIVAIVIRLVLGILLIHQSGISRYPLAIEIIGWLSIVAAVSFTVIGHGRFIRLIAWTLGFVKPMGRPGGIIASVFGVFLVYAFV